MQILVNLGAKSPRWNRQSRILGHVIRSILEATVRVNRFYMRLHRVPLLYQAGIRYQEEPEGQVEEFATVPVLLARKFGDCDDLAPYRVAELLEQGEKASIRLIWRKNPLTGKRMYHVMVRRGDGSVEDPSRILGMK